MEGRLMLYWCLVVVEIQGAVATTANWSQWEPLDCENGTQMRTRSCQTDPNCMQTGEIQTRSCNTVHPSVTTILDTGTARKALLGVSETHHILQNHVIKRLQTTSVIECALHCLRSDNCLSLNIKGTLSDGAQWSGSLKVECQLNNENQRTFPTDFVFYEGYTHMNVIEDSSLLP